MLNEYVRELLVQIRHEEIKKEVLKMNHSRQKSLNWIQSIQSIRKRFDDRFLGSVKGQLACCSTSPCC